MLFEDELLKTDDSTEPIAPETRKTNSKSKQL